MLFRLTCWLLVGWYLLTDTSTSLIRTTGWCMYLRITTQEPIRSLVINQVGYLMLVITFGAFGVLEGQGWGQSQDQSQGPSWVGCLPQGGHDHGELWRWRRGLGPEGRPGLLQRKGHEQSRGQI